VKLIDVDPKEAQKPDWNPEQGPSPARVAPVFDTDTNCRSGDGWYVCGSYLQSFEQNRALAPTQTSKWQGTVADHDHTFF